MNRFFAGSAMGLAVGAGLMLLPGARKLQRSVAREAGKLKRQLQHR